MPDLTLEFAGSLLANRLNFDPYFGYGYENYARVYAYWNYLAINKSVAPFGYRDSEGKWVVFFSSVDEQGITRVFKAYRDFEYELTYVNEPVTPPFLEEGEVVHSVRGLGTYFIVLRLTNEMGVFTRAVLVKTTSSDWTQWTNPVVLDEYVSGSSFCYDHKSGNFIKVWPENDGTEIWYSLFNPNFSYLISPTKICDTSEDFVYTDATNEYEWLDIPSAVLPHGLSVTYDRVNEELLVVANIATQVMDTINGGATLVYHEATLNYSMAESTLADGVGLVLNNIPFGESTNYYLFESNNDDDGICFQGPRSSVTFDEYFEGGVINTEYDWADKGEINLHAAHAGVSVRGCYSLDSDNTTTHVFKFLSGPIPSPISISFTKGLYAAGNKLIPTGNLGGPSTVPTGVDIVNIVGDTLRIGPVHQPLEPGFPAGDMLVTGRHVTTVMNGGVAKTYSFDKLMRDIHLIWDDGAVLASNTGIRLPTLPVGFRDYGSWTFDGNAILPTFYFLVSSKSWDGTPLQHTPVVLRYREGDPNVGHGAGWTLFSAPLDPLGKEESKASLQSTVAAPTQISGYNDAGGPSIYTENGHVVFVMEWETDVRGTRPTVCVFDPETDSVTHPYRTDNATFGPHGIGHHPAFGYYIADSVTDTDLHIRTQDLASYEDFWSGASSTVYKLPLARSSHPQMEVMRMPVFVGGRFSMVNPTDVDLMLNKTNYVYVERLLDPPHDVDFLVTDQLLPNSFHRALLAVVECDAHGPISQKTYTANWRA